MRPPIEPTPEQVTSDAQGNVLDMTAQQENIEGVYAPPPVSRECAQQNTYHDIFVGYGPPPVMQPTGLSQMLMQQQAAQPAKPQDASVWVCACGAENKRKFCTECGKPRPETWVCGCGAENKGKFCTNCGSPRR